MSGPEAPPRSPGLRIVLDARPLQEPERAPATSAYLRGLLGAFDAAPLPGESFAFLLQSDLEDPTTGFEHLDVVGRRLLPPTRLLRTGALAVDPFLLRGASLGAAWRAGRGGAAGAVYHAAAGAPPVLSRLPIVVTLLDLAPWELAGAYQRTAAARFGQQLRGRLLREAAAVVVGTQAVARLAARRLRLRPERVRVIPLAPDPAFTDAGRDAAATGDSVPGWAEARPTEEATRLGLTSRYLVYPGRFDAREDLGTLFAGLARLAAAGRPRSLPGAAPWPPAIVVTGATPDDRAAMARAASRHGVGDALVYAPALAPDRLAALVRGSRAVLLPKRSEAAGLAAIDALAAGTPVIATNVGALPEIVGPAGILVEPGDPDRLAAALRSATADERIHRRIAAAARDRAAGAPRTWADVAAETRRLYADVGVARRSER